MNFPGGRNIIYQINMLEAVFACFWVSTTGLGVRIQFSGNFNCVSSHGELAVNQSRLWTVDSRSNHATVGITSIRAVYPIMTMR